MIKNIRWFMRDFIKKNMNMLDTKFSSLVVVGFMAKEGTHGSQRKALYYWSSEYLYIVIILKYFKITQFAK